MKVLKKEGESLLSGKSFQAERAATEKALTRKSLMYLISEISGLETHEFKDLLRMQSHRHRGHRGGAEGVVKL